jgi:RNA-binding protein YlmH
VNIKNDVIKAARNEEEKVLLVKILDYVEQVQKYSEPRFTQFLDPSQVAKAESVLKRFSDVRYVVDGGVKNCERKIVAIFPVDMEDNMTDIPVVPIGIKGNFRFESISHRDVLGALMSLGIKRDKVGDIILDDSSCFIIASSDISNYICLNLTKIKHTSVTAGCLDFASVPDKTEKYKEIISNVASLRLDSILSAGFGESRNSISKEISRNNVRVNWEEVIDTSHTVAQGDVISLKGRGRIVLEEVGSMTKKGRIKVIIKKIL